jgi:predicted anti-sigma-YlaC factor YlaD
MSTAISPACEAVRDSLSAFIDGDAGAEDRRRIEAHLGTCASCARYFRTMRDTVEICRKAPRPCLGEDCFHRAVTAARAELERRGLL